MLGPSWGCPPSPRSQSAHASPSAAQRASLPSGGPQSHGLHHHCPLPPHCQRCWVPQGHGVFAPTPIHATPVRPSISTHCTPVWHHGEHHPYLPSRHPGRSAARCQWRSVPPCPADGSSPPVRPFQCYPVNVHHFAVFHGSPRQEGRSHTAPRAVGWPLASSIQWSLRLFSLLGILLPPLWSLRLLFLLGTCQLHQLCCSSSCSWHQLSCCSHCPRCPLDPG